MEELSVAERRERRKQRILSNTEGRINSILSGPDGSEQRSAPAIDGGNGFNIQSSSLASSTDSSTTPSPQKSNSTITSYMRQSKYGFVLLFGVLARFALLSGLEANIILPWIIIYISFELMFNKENRLSTINNEIMQTLTIAIPMLRTSFIKDIGYFLSVMRDLCSDTMNMVTGFLMTHAALVVYDQIVSL